MAEKRSSHLRVVPSPVAPARPAEAAAADTDPIAGTGTTVSYWAELQALRDERRRLRTGRVAG
ncbi:hypothetical protein SAMN04489867_2672 [Pedococcus dokdonensis]|uniref:Uncharacterized protein n=1 Tax=Pedococcus dokdonensis TaxID=443156 RepID=A0A1H0T7L7_9MICO|nr:hypothetical protein [Pedococcus dokdonensis]SDP49994.1 hypothetical protein SAMN04489867_2672 [Pedococcus dokdonensis]